MRSVVCEADAARAGVTAAARPSVDAGVAVAPAAGRPCSSSAATEVTARCGAGAWPSGLSSATVQSDASSSPESAPPSNVTAVVVTVRTAASKGG